MNLKYILALVLVITSAKTQAMSPETLINRGSQVCKAAGTHVSQAMQSAWKRVTARPQALVTHTSDAIKNAVLAKQLQVSSFLSRNKLALTASGGVIAGILAAVAVRYGYDYLKEVISDLRLKQTAERVALATDYESKKTYTITVDLRNSSCPIIVKEQQKRPGHPLRSSLPQLEQVTLNDAKKSDELLSKVMTIIYAMYRNPYITISPAVAMGAAFGAIKLPNIQLKAASGGISLLSALLTRYLWNEKISVEKKHINNKQTVLKTIQTLIDHAKTVKNSLPCIYSVNFDFDSQTADITYEPQAIYTHDILPTISAPARHPQQLGITHFQQ